MQQTTVKPTYPSSVDPIDENAYHFHRPSWQGGSHRSEGQESNPKFNLDKSSYYALNRAVQNNVNAILEAGDDDQVVLALRETLDHTKIRPFAQRIWGSVFSDQSSLGRRALDGMRGMADRIAGTKNKGMLSKKCRALLNVICMCLVRGDESDKGNARAIRRHVLTGYSHGAANRILNKAGKKRKRFDDEDLSNFDIYEREAIRCKYNDEEMEDFRTWMVTNPYARTSPMKDHTVIRRDHRG